MSRLSRWFRSRRIPPMPTTLPLVPTSPYTHLLAAPRFEVRTEQFLGEPFQIPDGITFYFTYAEIFIEELYRFQSTSPAPLIVDGGANCGVSVAYFKRLFPDARVIAVEADPHIFAMLERNVAQLKLTDVTLINKAIAVGGSEVTFYREGSNAGRIHALDEALEQFTVPVVTLDELITEPVDMLKLDVEGAESAAICTSQKLADVSQMMVEYHSFADAPQSLADLLGKLAVGGFRYKMQTMFCSKRPLVDDVNHLGMDLQLNIYAKRANLPSSAYGDGSTPTVGQQVGRIAPAA